MRIDAARIIKDRLTMPEILNMYGFDTSRRKRIPCPLHNGDDDNFSYKDDFFKCFSCGEYGDVITFVQKYFSIGFQNAIVKINEDFSLNLPIGENADRRKQIDIARRSFQRKQEQKRKAETRKSLENAYEKAMDEFVRLDKQKTLYAPKKGETTLHPLFVEAICEIEYAKYVLAYSEMELYRYEQQNDRNT